MGIPISFSGTVRWKNGLPAQGVEVRIFDQDAGGTDDDATLSPGRSGSDGRFTLSYDIDRGIDTRATDVPYLVWVGGAPWRGGHWEQRTHRVDAPDPTDTWKPYLLFRYTVQGQAFEHWEWFTPLNQPCRLPHVGAARADTALAAQRDVAGRAVVAVVQQPGGKLRLTTNASGNDWSAFADHGTVGATPIALAVDAPGRLIAVLRDGAGVSLRSLDGAPGLSATLGGAGGTQVAAARNRDTRLEVVAEGAGGAILSARGQADGTVPALAPLGGGVLAPGGGLCLAANADGRLELFVNGTDGAIWHCWQQAPGGAWSGWNSLGGLMAAGPVAAARDGGGRLFVFALGIDGSAMFSSQAAPNAGPWSAWSSLGGTWLGRFKAVSDGAGRISLFAQDPDFNVQRIGRDANGGWGGWEMLGLLQPNSLFGGSPSEWSFDAGVMADGRLFAMQELRLEGEAPYWFRAQQPGGGWTPWARLGQPSPPAAPGVPQGFTLTSAANRLHAAWSAVAGASAYELRYGTSAGNQAFRASVAGTAASADIQPLSNGLTYVASVRALNAGGGSGWSGDATAMPSGARDGVFDLQLADYQPSEAPLFNRFFTVSYRLRNPKAKPTGPFTITFTHVHGTATPQAEGIANIPSIDGFGEYRGTVGFTVAHGPPLPPNEAHVWRLDVAPDWFIGQFDLIVSGR